MFYMTYNKQATLTITLQYYSVQEADDILAIKFKYIITLCKISNVHKNHQTRNRKLKT